MNSVEWMVGLEGFAFVLLAAFFFWMAVHVRDIKYKIERRHLSFFCSIAGLISIIMGLLSLLRWLWQARQGL